MGQASLRTAARRTAGWSAIVTAATLLASACSAAGPSDDPLDGEDAPFADGKADGLTAGSNEAAAVLALVNDPEVDLDALDIDAKLHKTAATNIIEHRNGPDGAVLTEDDNRLDTLQELDAIKFVGPRALGRLLDYAIAEGYLDAIVDGGGTTESIDVIFSPQPAESSHNARVAELIGNAEHTIDIAMYSFSDAGIADALEAATARGVSVRFIFETANKDRKADPEDMADTKSGRLEQDGVDVRWVNKIMHHKFMIVDGPRNEASRAATAQLVSGSANWSFGGASRYDENTLFMTEQAEFALSMQREFNHLWQHGREFDAGEGLHEADAQLEITEQTLDAVDQDDGHIFYTSDNFDVSGDTFKKTGRNTVSDQLVAAIEAATDSIHVASGHLRLRPVSEALQAKAQANPEMDIRVYLDAQEYVSATTHSIQLEDLQECVDEATTQSKINSCMDKGFRFGFQIGEAGVDVRYKWYAQRWHFSYAEQMHHKYMIIDGDELWTGSYNLSDNAEHNTFENMFVFEGPRHAGLIAQYEANFDRVWSTGRDEGLLEDLIEEIETSDIIPIVFESMALGHEEVRQLKALIVSRCPAVNSSEFRSNPAAHHTCEVD